MISTTHVSTVRPDRPVIMFTFNTGPIHISSALACQPASISAQNEECETLHEGYFNTTTPPTTHLSSKAVAGKDINPEEKSESKLLMLRNIDTDYIHHVSSST